MLLALGVTMALLIGGVVLLLRGADWFMDGVGDLARMLGVSDLALGAVLAGLEPEEMLTAAAVRPLPVAPVYPSFDTITGCG